MTVSDYLRDTTSLLAANSIATARLDTLIILEYILGVDRAKILASTDTVIATDQKKLLDRAVSKRLKHVPISYITHNKEFYGRNFFIDNHVLEPRPESESMIDLFKDIMSSDKLLLAKQLTQTSVKVADIGTGSGALGITAKLECQNTTIDLIDVDKKALKVAKQNVVLQTIQARLLNADLLVSNNEKYDVLLCNLPYVPDEFTINLAAAHEPKIAIFGGKDGLDIYRKFFKLLKYRQHKPLYVLTEALPSSHQGLDAIAKHSGYKEVVTKDFIQLFRLSTN